MTTIFCDCGRIINVDSVFNEHCLGSGKRAICHFCRNRRIQIELSCLDEHYNIIEGETEFRIAF